MTPHLDPNHQNLLIHPDTAQALNHPQPEQLADVFNASVSTLLARLDTPLGLVAN